MTVTFLTDRDVEAAANDVRDMVSRIQTFFPETAYYPVVSKIDSYAWPFMWLSF